MSTPEKTTEVVEVVTPKKPKRWNFGGMFWGLLLVLVGVLLLLDNLNVITTQFDNIWQLWPVLIIGAGLSFLSLRGWLGALIFFLAAVALLGLVAFTVVENPWYANVHQSSGQTTSQADDAAQAKKLDVTIDAGAASIALSSGRDRQGVRAEQRSTRQTLTKEARTEGDTRYVKFLTKGSHSWWFGGGRNEIALDLTRSLPVALTIDTGATSVTGDLSQVRLASLNIDTGASSVDLRLGALEKRQDITLDAGASSIVLHIPKGAGVRLESKGGLTKTDFEGLEKVSDSVYETPGFSDADRQIFIRSDMGASKFEIVRY